MARGERPRDSERLEPQQAILWVRFAFFAENGQKIVKKSQKISIYILYMKIGRFSMGVRNLGSESPLGQREKSRNLKTAVKLNSRVELSSCLEKMNL